MSVRWKEAKGWLSDKEREMLFNLADTVRSLRGVIVNIGVEFGASVVCLRAGNLVDTIYAVDIDTSKVAFSPQDLSINLIEQDSKDFVAQWDGLKPPISLLFIDGDHSYKGVLNDLELARHVAVGGYVVLHDCYEWGTDKEIHKIVPEVNEAVDDWFDNLSEDSPEYGFVEGKPCDSMRIFEREFAKR